MDYELMMNSHLTIGQKAPDFKVNTTLGERKLEDYKGKYIVIFSYPGDFDYLSETEIIKFSNVYSYFENLNTELLGLSVDSILSHFAWINDIYMKTKIQIPFPLIADRNGKIARLYGMIAKDISNTETVRNVVIIDKAGFVKVVLTYPINIERNINEIIRIVNNFQNLE